MSQAEAFEAPGVSQPSGPGARPRLLPDAGTSVPAARTPVEPSTDLELLSECVGLWGLYRAGILTYDELDRSLVEVEARWGIEVELCDSCLQRRATIIDHGHRVCGTCRNNGCRCGDCVDEGYARWKDWSE